MTIEDATDRLERAAADAPTIRADGKIVWTDQGICRVCGCSSEDGCPGGCIWAEPNLCSRCALGRSYGRPGDILNDARVGDRRVRAALRRRRGKR